MHLMWVGQRQKFYDVYNHEAYNLGILVFYTCKILYEGFFQCFPLIHYYIQTYYKWFVKRFSVSQVVRETLFGLCSVLSLVMIFSSQTVLQPAVILAYHSLFILPAGGDLNFQKPQKQAKK
jgi:hypothetical protein